MYEVELRSLIKDIKEMQKKIKSFSKTLSENEREVNIFFINPLKKDFDIKIRLRKNKYFLMYKGSSKNKARIEFESQISDPCAVFNILVESGFQIELAVARIKYTYKYENYEIMLNEVINWGDAVEAEIIIDDNKLAEAAENNVKKFMKSKLGITNLLSNSELEILNKIYQKKLLLNKIKMNELMDYVNNKTDKLNFFKNN